MSHTTQLICTHATDDSIVSVLSMMTISTDTGMPNFIFPLSGALCFKFKLNLFCWYPFSLIVNGALLAYAMYALSRNLKCIPIFAWSYFMCSYWSTHRNKHEICDWKRCVLRWMIISTWLIMCKAETIVRLHELDVFHGITSILFAFNNIYVVCI